MVFIGVQTDDVAEEPETPEHDRWGDKRLSFIIIIVIITVVVIVI